MSMIVNSFVFDSSGFSAIGGTITTDGDYKVHKFTSSGSFILSGGSIPNISYLVVGGGGSGAYSANENAAGGDAGQHTVDATTDFAVGTYQVVVGVGANISSPENGAPGNNGGSSSFNGTTSTGGNGGDGGSDGGDGAGSLGGTGTTILAGDGGDGLANSITGSSVYRAGGGGGCCSGGGLDDDGAGGLGGGGDAGVDGTDGTGGGGGGGISNKSVVAGTGGTGVVIIRYKFQNL